MSKLVTLTIDGKQVTVPAGTLIVDAAKQVGVDIPVFCYHPKMEPAGMCRMCLVEVGRPVIDRATGQPVLDEDGQPQIRFFPKLETACTNPVSEGMVVKTQTEKAAAGRKEILEFLLTSHPLDCPICDKGGECALQDLTLAHGPAQSRFLFDEKFHNDKHVPLGDLIYLDRERCIQCGRCIRFQKDIAGDAVIQFYHRGRATEIITVSDPGFDSLFSGNTTDICPVGALTTADFRFGARPWELKAAASICSQCPVGCNIVFNTRREVKSGGRVVIKRVMPRQNEEVNELWICDKGRFAAYHYTETENRLTEPLMRTAEGLQPTDWETALDAVSVKMGAVGPQVTVLTSGRLSNEDLFNLKTLADELGGQALLYTDMGGGEWTQRYGLSAGDDLGALGADDAVVVVAADLYEEAPVWYLRVKAAAERGARLFVLNTRGTRLDKYASQVQRYAPGEAVAAVQSLPVDELQAARRLVVFYGADGLGRKQTEALAAACGGLLEATGHENGLVAVWPRVNDQGAWELGFRPAEDLAAALADQVVYIVGADPAGDDPALAAALQAANAVIVQDLVSTATAQMADVVLPAQAYTEREGSYTSGERRVQRFYPAVPPQGQARADYAIVAQIAAKLGIQMEGRSARLVMERIAAAVPAFADITYGTLSAVRAQSPQVDPYYTGTAYRNGQGMGAYLARVGDLVPSPVAAAAAPSAGEGLLALPFSRAYDRGSTVWPSVLLRARIGDPFVVLHPADADRLGLNGQARLQLGGQEYAVAVVRDETVTAGTVLVPRSMGLPIHAPQTVSLAAQSER